MSLTSELRDVASPVRQFFNEHLPNVRPVQQAWWEGLGGATSLRPSVPDVEVRAPYGTIGTAIDYRLRFYFRAKSRQYVASQGALLLNSRAPASYDIEKEVLIEPPQVRLTQVFFKSLNETVRKLRPERRKLRSPQEKLLCRYCYVLALFEEVFRAGPQVNSPLYSLASDTTLRELLAFPESAWVDDLCQLSWAFYRRFHRLLSRPAVLNPTFDGSADIGGGDADLIVDRCLLDIKTTVGLPSLSRNWLYQLVGYVLLDYRDKYAIDSVGIYLTRQLRLVRWPLTWLLTTLAGTSRLSLLRLRRAFRQVIRDVRYQQERELAAEPRRIQIKRETTVK